MSEWRSSSTIPELASWLAGATRVLVTTHIKPDGDAVGSTVALARALTHHSPGRDVSLVYHGPLPAWLRTIAGRTAWHVAPEPGWVPATEPDAIAVLDTGSWTQLEPVAAYLRPRADRAAIVDHHRHGNADLAPRRVIETAAAAVCQPVAALCVALLDVASPARLPADVAEPLYLGLATDTGWFKHSNVDAAAMRLAASLIEAGARPNWLYQETEQRDTPARLALMARAIASLSITDRGRVGLMKLTRRDFAETGAAPGDSGAFIDIPQSIGSVRVAAMLTEADPAEYGLAGAQHLTKISLRSKAGVGDCGTPEVDVDRIARTLGGGGHARAAGAKLAKPLDLAEADVLAAIRSAL